MDHGAGTQKLLEVCEAWGLKGIATFLFSACIGKKVLRFTKETVLLGEVVGEGAYAFVYKAESSSTGAQYAVKMIFLHDATYEESAQQEVMAYKTFQHGNMLQMLDCLEAENDEGQRVMYLLFPFQEQGNLRQALDARLNNPGLIPRPPLTSVLRSFRGVCEVVNMLHSHEPRYVHFDLKPDNVLISDESEPLLMDFNSVRVAEVTVETRSDALGLSEAAASFCTVSYRAPELFDPPKGVTVDTRTDVWALGCLLFAWWFGYSPFECEFSEVGRPRVVECSSLRVLSEVPAPPNPTADDKVILELVHWILQKDFSIRPYTTDVLERLDECIVKYGGKGGGVK